MLPEIKTAWVRALRSGEYTQGRGTLERDGKFCCLGVLADVIQKQFPDILSQAGCRISGSRSMEIWYDGNRESRSGGLPESLTNAIGMEHHAQDCLAARNDGGMPFTNIAAIIEETL